MVDVDRIVFILCQRVAHHNPVERNDNKNLMKMKKRRKIMRIELSLA